MGNAAEAGDNHVYPAAMEMEMRDSLLTTGAVACAMVFGLAYGPASAAVPAMTGASLLAPALVLPVMDEEDEAVEEDLRPDEMPETEEEAEPEDEMPEEGEGGDDIEDEMIDKIGPGAE